MSQQIELESEFNNTGHSFKSEQPIFGQNFKVADMSDPKGYLPQYGQHAQSPILQPGCVQQSNSCCGSICVCLAYPFACCCCKCCCVYELQTGSAGIVQEFGRFSRLMNPGFNMINPCTQQVKNVDMRMKIMNAGTSACITKDNVKVSVNTSIGYRVGNPVQVYYILGQQIGHALVESTHAAIRNAVGESILDDVLSHRDKIINLAMKIVKQNLPLGIVLENLFIQDIIIPQQTLKDLSSAARQRRIGQANIINSQADVESAGLMKEAAQLMDTKAAMQIRYLEMVTEMGKKGAKLLMPIGVNATGSQKQ